MDASPLVRTLHRNLLLPVLAIREPEPRPTEDRHKTVGHDKVVVRGKTTVSNDNQAQEDSTVTEDHESDSESECDLMDHTVLNSALESEDEGAHQASPLVILTPPTMLPDQPSREEADPEQVEEMVGQADGGQDLVDLADNPSDIEPRRSGRARSQPAWLSGEEFDLNGGIYMLEPTRAKLGDISGQNSGTYYSLIKEVVWWCLGVSGSEFG